MMNQVGWWEDCRGAIGCEGSYDYLMMDCYLT